MAQSLKIWMRNDVKNQIALDVDKPIERVVDNFFFVQIELNKSLKSKNTGIH